MNNLDSEREVKKGPSKNKEQESKSEYTGIVPAVDQAGKILLCLAGSAAGKMNLTDICRIVGIHKSKGHSILKTLQRFGFVVKDPIGKTYSLGLGLVALSRRVLDKLNYNDVAAPFLRIMAEKTHSTALFGLLSGSNTFVVAKQEIDQNVGITTRVGHRFTLTHGAHGKVIVAFIKKEEREKILSQKDLYFHGSSSKYSARRLQGEIIKCRETGYAIDMGDLVPGMNVIASPVFDAQNRIIGSIFIMGVFPESSVEIYGPIVAESAKQFSAMLGADAEHIYKDTKQEYYRI